MLNAPLHWNDREGKWRGETAKLTEPEQTFECVYHMATMMMSFGALDKYINACTAKQPPSLPDSKRINSYCTDQMCVCVWWGGACTYYKNTNTICAKARGEQVRQGCMENREREKDGKREREKKRASCLLLNNCMSNAGTME